MTRWVHVAAGVIFDDEGNILIAKRLQHLHQGGLWEFPGGKLEPDETARDALARELKEELQIQVISAQPLIEIRHRYNDKSVLLDVWRVDKFVGEPAGNEGQEIKWIKPAELPNYEFPAANRDIVLAVMAL